VATWADRRDRDLGPHGCGRRHGVVVEEADHLGRSQVAVRVVAAVGEAREPGHPVGRQQAQGVPPLGAPRVGHLAAFEDDVLDRTRGEDAADGEPAVPGPDDDRGRVVHGVRRR
jgi:hypothetical protein